MERPHEGGLDVTRVRPARVQQDGDGGGGGGKGGGAGAAALLRGKATVLRGKKAAVEQPLQRAAVVAVAGGESGEDDDAIPDL